MMFWRRKENHLQELLAVARAEAAASKMRCEMAETQLKVCEDTVRRLTESPTLFCSFCHKSQHNVKKLFAAPAACICDDCTRLAMDILIEEGRK